MKKELQVIMNAEKIRSDVNRSLLGICFTLFTIIVALNPSLLKDNILLTIELTIAIPLLITSSFAKAKITHTNRTNLWVRYAFYTFILAYSMLINVIGIFLSIFVNTQVSMIFFGVNIITALFYSGIYIIENQRGIFSRFFKDALFIILIILGGILPALKVY